MARNHAAQCDLQLRVGARDRAAVGVGERRTSGAVGEVGADLSELRIGAEGIEAGHGEVELAAERAHELVTGAALGVDDRRVVGKDLGELGIERRHVALHRGDARLDEVGGEREAGGVLVAHLAAGAVAGRAVGAGRALVALDLGLLGGNRRELQERRLELLEPRRGAVQRGLHLADGAFGRARGLRAALQHLPVEAEAEPDGDDGQEDVAADVGEPREPVDGREHLVEQPHDHRHQHRNREADDDFVEERQVAHVRFYELEHADVGRDPRQRGKAADEE